MKPINHGSVLVVGAKASNFDDELRGNPRLIIWDSQDKKWNDKNLPINTQAIFFTRWTGHSEFTRIMTEARRKRITVFTPQGTGLVIKQVKELLGMNGTPEVARIAVELPKTIVETKKMPLITGKLDPLRPFIDITKKNKENVEILLAKAQELGIQTTRASLVQICYQERKKLGAPLRKQPRKLTTPPKYKEVDAAVEIFDNILKELTDMRQFLVSTVEENTALKSRIEKFKKTLSED